MADKVVEEHVIHSDGGGGAFTALAVVLVVLVLLVVLYFTGVLARIFAPRDTKIDVEIKKPGVVLKVF